MHIQSRSLELKIYISSLKLFQKATTLINAIFIGFWLGFLDKENLYLVDKAYYDNTKNYCDETYNKSGLWSWEKQMLDTYFTQCKHLLIGGVGGGREVLGLLKLGYEVDGFECNPNFVEFANKLIEAEGYSTKIKLIERDQYLQSPQEYDGLIVGWGAYMLIQGREQRISFLKGLRGQVKENSPLLLSFFCRYKNSYALKIIVTIGNIIRWIARRELLELGDYLSPNYVHYFSKQEIAQELKAAGFELMTYQTQEYGHAVGFAQ